MAYLAGLAIVLILAGYRGQSAAQLNQGLLVIVGVVAARFFDSDVSMLYRGIGFVGAGIGFLVSNYLLLKRKKGVGQ